ncbi:hypothetical protein Pse7367_2148 [Thalassoporum mexicanum PCC 7367]|uniref:porin family protein n=1 Tax=Thalassoporum mexicanum TaxID=3457544 RepID=UPI00029F96EE|nr:porin family protein [Pseudanabaena sp. PCC 7367]AFY70412.1 hypothetical protein Pse7367_2148 [Pseudanabaena sp. PCC 7367]
MFRSAQKNSQKNSQQNKKEESSRTSLIQKLNRIPLKLIVLTASLVNVPNLVSLPALADEVRSPSSYVGAGVSLTSGRETESSLVGANVAGRLKLGDAPLSLRTSVLFGEADSAAIVPTASYDFALGDRTNVYLGAGVVIPTSDGETMLGDKTAFVVQPGVEVSLSKDVLLYGNAIVAVDSYETGSSGVSVQAGIGYQF